MSTAAANARETRSAAEGGWIALDWGSSRLRAWRVDAAGRVLERRESAQGALSLRGERFDAALVASVGDWVESDSPRGMIACGMVGSRNGWREAAYVGLPAGIDEVAAAAIAVPTSLGLPLRIVPGLLSDEPDVARGEETQALGCGADDALLCMPGTHSKWMRLRGGRICGFETWFTGELFEMLGTHGSLAAAFGPAGEFDRAGFERGVADAIDDRTDGPWLHRLFGFRARVVGAGAAGAAERARLSGWLIASELLHAWRRAAGAEGRDVLLLVGEGALLDLYERAAGAVAPYVALAQEPPAAIARAPSDSALRGLLRIAARLDGDRNAAR